MGLVIMPVMLFLVWAWLCVTFVLIAAAWYLLRKLPFGPILAPLGVLAVISLCCYLPNAKGLSEQKRIDRVATDCGLTVASTAESVTGIYFESDAFFDSDTSVDPLRKIYQIVEFRGPRGGVLQSSDPREPWIKLSTPTQKYTIQVRESSTDTLVRRDERVLDLETKMLLARHVSYSKLSEPSMSGPMSVAMYHLTYQSKPCRGIEVAELGAWLPRVLRPAERGSPR